ncbi:MAG: DUF3592 domain-containing protein [Cytophagales bacterium]|nr:DUF3592 domain-containing protein [Cytophagales bacterium]
MNSAKKTHQSIKRNIRLVILIAVLMLLGVGAYWFQVWQHPAFQVALRAIDLSEELAVVSGNISRIGWMPSHDVTENGAEYWIKVFSEQGSDGHRRVWVYLEKDELENWVVDHFSVEFINERSGNDAMVVVSLISGLLFLLSFIICMIKYMARVRFLEAASFREVVGEVVNVDARLEKSTMPGQSNAGVLKSDFENRSTESTTMMYKPKVRFKTEQGEAVVLKHDFSSNKKYAIGDRVQVLYDANHPEKAELVDFFWFWPQFWFVIMIVFLVFVAGATALMTLL